MYPSTARPSARAARAPPIMLIGDRIVILGRSLEASQELGDDPGCERSMGASAARALRTTSATALGGGSGGWSTIHGDVASPVREFRTHRGRRVRRTSCPGHRARAEAPRRAHGHLRLAGVEDVPPVGTDARRTKVRQDPPDGPRPSLHHDPTRRSGNRTITFSPRGRQRVQSTSSTSSSRRNPRTRGRATRSSRFGDGRTARSGSPTPAQRPLNTWAIVPGDASVTGSASNHRMRSAISSWTINVCATASDGRSSTVDGGASYRRVRWTWSGCTSCASSET